MDTLIESAQQGNAEAFAALYAAHSGLVRAACRTVVEPSDVEDVAQDAWLTVLRRIHTFRGDAAFTTWLYRVAVNAAKMQRRRRLILVIPLVDLRAEPSNPPPQDFLSVKEALATLPTGYRTVLEMHTEGYDHAEIALQLGCATGTVKSQLFKARRAARRRLQ